MPILPLQAAGALIAAAPLAEAAISSASSAFAGLLSAVASRAPASEADGPRFGLEGLNGGGPLSTGTGKLRAKTDSLLQQFHQLLTKLINEHGIEADGEFRLVGDEAGQVYVDGGHPESSRIDQLFASTPELQTLFNSINAHASLLRAIERAADTTGGETSLFQQPLGLIVTSENATIAS